MLRRHALPIKIVAICCEKWLATIIMFIKYITKCNPQKKSKGSFKWKCISIYQWLFKIRRYPLRSKVFFWCLSMFSFIFRSSEIWGELLSEQICIALDINEKTQIQGWCLLLLQSTQASKVGDSYVDFSNWNLFQSVIKDQLLIQQFCQKFHRSSRGVCKVWPFLLTNYSKSVIKVTVS